jgi:hypothetical protein
MVFAPMELRQRAFNLYENGHSCSRIAQLLTEEHKKLTGRPLTKNAIIGWRNRSNNCRPVEKIKVDFNVFMDQLQAYKKHLEETTKEEYRIRKCLRCRKESVFPKNTFLCEPCKKQDVFRYVA